MHRVIIFLMIGMAAGPSFISTVMMVTVAAPPYKNYLMMTLN